MKELVDAMATVGLYDTAIMALGVVLYHVPGISKEHARFHDVNRLFQAFSSCLDHAYRVRIRPRSFAHIVSLIEIAVEAFVVKRDVEVEDITIKKYSLIRYTMADNFIR
jgi:hypothetical protein